MYDRNGFAIDSGGWVLWESLDPSVAQVSTLDGSVSAVANGTARIVANSFSGAQDTVYVVVNAPAPEARRLVSVAPATSFSAVRVRRPDPPYVSGHEQD